MPIKGINRGHKSQPRKTDADHKEMTAMKDAWIERMETRVEKVEAHPEDMKSLQQCIRRSPKEHAAVKSVR
jgi:hypothetical protein